MTTLCPCSKEISDYGAHNQRGVVTVSVQFKRFFWLEDLIALIERLFELRRLLGAQEAGREIRD